ncbi:DUF7793 family protein [Dinghuibacter silviterrae]|uniref:DUF7793 family protein n=1 Tax=Dinghuibacter silviterrae TaxID=1539049 RepID=UPI0010642018|nr:hypothetical protein [Dinghuibacter silviterrae]
MKYMKKRETEFFTLIPKDGYVFAEWNKGHRFVDLEDVEREVDGRVEWQGEESLDYVIRFPNPFKFSSKASHYLKSAEGRRGIKRCAILADNLFWFAALKFAFWVSQDDFPITVVRSEEEAVEWFKLNPVALSFN